MANLNFSTRSVQGHECEGNDIGPEHLLPIHNLEQDVWGGGSETESTFIAASHHHLLPVCTGLAGTIQLRGLLPCCANRQKPDRVSFGMSSSQYMT